MRIMPKTINVPPEAHKLLREIQAHDGFQTIADTILFLCKWYRRVLVAEDEYNAEQDRIASALYDEES